MLSLCEFFLKTKSVRIRKYPPLIAWQTHKYQHPVDNPQQSATAKDLMFYSPYMQKKFWLHTGNSITKKEIRQLTKDDQNHLIGINNV
jgi:hypothetical protein